MVSVINNQWLQCTRCTGKMMVDRTTITSVHLELYCIVCGHREMYNQPDSCGESISWIMKMERDFQNKSLRKI
jgi:hypothetical protein